MRLLRSPDLSVPAFRDAAGARRSRLLLALVLATATAGAPAVATAETSASAAKAQEWMAAKQRVERAMIDRLKAKFNSHPAIKSGMRDFARKLLEEIKFDVVDGEDTAISGVNRISIRGLSFTPKAGASDQAAAIAKLDALLALDTVPVEVLGDIMWMFNFGIAYQRNARTTEMFAHSEGIGDIDASTVWAEKPSASAVGRHRVTNGDEIATLKANNDATDPGGLHAEVARCGGCALKRTAMRPTSVVLRVEKALGFMVGADLSGTTNVYTWQLEHAGFNDPLWKLIPLVTMVPDGDHSLLEVALVLHSHGYIDYKIGDYRTLLGPTSHPAAAEVRSILAEASTDPASVPMYCWYGTTNQVVGCRRSGGGETVKDLGAGEVYSYFANASADTATAASPANALNAFGFLKADAAGFPFAPASPIDPTAPEMCEYQLPSGTATIAHKMPCKFKAVKVADNTVFYKGGYKSEGWQIGGGYVSHLGGATAYARGMMTNATAGQVSMYSAKANGDQYLIDIRDLPTLKALFSIPGALAGYSDLTSSGGKLVYEGDDSPFPTAQIGALFGYAVDEKKVRKAISKNCGFFQIFNSACYAREFAKVRTAGNPYAADVKTLAEVVASPWAALSSFRLFRFSVFLKNSDTAERVVPDTVITDKLCPYLSAMGFAGWYGGTDIPVDLDDNLIEEIYFCWNQPTLKEHARNDDPKQWSRLPATRSPDKPALIAAPKGLGKPAAPTTVPPPIPTTEPGAPEMCDYRMTVGKATVTHTMPCTLKAVKVEADTVFYKGGYLSEGWKIGGGYVSHVEGATAYAQSILDGAPPDQKPPSVTLYSAKANGDQYLIDIRDLPTLKALFSLPNALQGYKTLNDQAAKLTYEGGADAFPIDQINSLFGYFVNETSLQRELGGKCDRDPDCWAHEFEKVKSSGSDLAEHVKTLADLVASPWADIGAYKLYRFSVFLKNTDTKRRVVPDTTITDVLCPYLAALGFAGWYGGDNIKTSLWNTLIEENYFCWGLPTLKDHSRADDAAAWPGLPKTKPPGAPADYFPKGIVKIPSGASGKTVNTTALGAARP